MTTILIKFNTMPFKMDSLLGHWAIRDIQWLYCVRIQEFEAVPHFQFRKRYGVYSC